MRACLSGDFLRRHARSKFDQSKRAVMVGPLEDAKVGDDHVDRIPAGQRQGAGRNRSEEHTSELQSLMRISYAVFCLKKKKQTKTSTNSADETNISVKNATCIENNTGA